MFFHLSSARALPDTMPEPALNFDIDRYINPFVPRSRLHLLPRPISWFLGYRSQPMPRIGSVLVWWWSFFGGFVAILVVEAVFHTQAIRDHGSPIVIASLVRNFLVTQNKSILIFDLGSRRNSRIQHHRIAPSPTTQCNSRSSFLSSHWCGGH